MTDHAKNISNSIQFYGIKPTNKWNACTWGVHKWGTGDQDLPQRVTKYLGESLSILDSTGKNAGKKISESLAMDSDVTDMTLTDRNGWKRVFPLPTTDSNERALTQWSEV